jgi:hypothetical protein
VGFRSLAPGEAKDMLRVFRKRIRRQQGGVNVAADLDAAVAANTGPSQRQSVRVRSRRRVVQRSSRSGAERPDEPPPKQKEDR